MNGLQISEQFFKECGLPAFQASAPEMMPELTFGLAGQGSECFGFDDEVSRDHDWGAGFCVWIPTERFRDWAPKLQTIYDSLPSTYAGFPVKGRAVSGEQRIGVQDGDMFFYQFIGNRGVPAEPFGWLRTGEEAYAVATNGKLFYAGGEPADDSAAPDAAAAFWTGGAAAPAKTKFARDYTELKKGYPEDIRVKKIAARAVKMAQSGQYNYVRCMGRGNRVAAFQAMAEFVKETCSMIHLLNHAYCPFYKWMWRSTKEQPVLGAGTAAALEALTADPYAAGAKDMIEEICIVVKKELQRQGLTDIDEDFLEPHGARIMARIKDPQVAGLPISYG